jgi:hypothetical protein
MNSLAASVIVFLSVAVAIVLPVEADFAVVDVEKAVIGDGDAMGVAGEVGKHCFRPGKGRLGVDEPCDRRSPGKENAM